MQHTFIIAEIGINHNGDLEIAKKLIDVASQAGCDAVKFQKRTIDIVYTKEMLDSPRQSPWGTTQREQKEGLEFGKAEYDIIDAYCNEKKISWFASAWDTESQKFLNGYNLKYNKVASPLIVRHDLLEQIASEGRYTFIGTGMSTLPEIDDAVSIFQKHNCPFELMHCVSVYPLKEEQANLKMIHTLKERYNCPVGYSGHEFGDFVSTIAAACGATSIERHITLDRDMYGSDQQSSIEPDTLSLLVKNIRKMEQVLGSGEKVLSDEEMAVKKKLRG